MSAPEQAVLIIAQPDLAAEKRKWLDQLALERRLSAKTIDAYDRDVTQFLRFLTEYGGGPPGLAAVSDLRPAEIRSFLANRRRDGAVGGRTLARGLAGIRSFFRFLEKKGLANAAAFSAIRTPKEARPLPRPLSVVEAVAVGDADNSLAE
ncbi:MAG: site-specific integrase, partial [Pseudomonadota bacterium]